MSLGSGIPDPGSRGQKAPNPGSRIRIRNTGLKAIVVSPRPYQHSPFLPVFRIRIGLRLNQIQAFNKNSIPYIRNLSSPRAGSLTLDFAFYPGNQCRGSVTFLYGFVSLANGSGSCYFLHWPSRRQQKLEFFYLLLFEGTFLLFFKDKKS